MKLRQQLARTAGFQNYYAMKLEQAEGFGMDVSGAAVATIAASAGAGAADVRSAASACFSSWLAYDGSAWSSPPPSDATTMFAPHSLPPTRLTTHPPTHPPHPQVLFGMLDGLELDTRPIMEGGAPLSINRSINRSNQSINQYGRHGAGLPGEDRL